jgi:hypothetical protein
MDKSISSLIAIFDNSKNIISNIKNTYKKFKILKEEEKILYHYLSNILINVRNIIDNKKIFLKKCGINVDDKYTIIINNILDKLNNNGDVNISKKGGLKLIGQNENESINLLDTFKIIEKNKNKNNNNQSNTNKYNSIKNIQLFFKNIYENYNKINDNKSFENIKLTDFEIIKNIKNISIKRLLQYFNKLLKRPIDNKNSNNNENNNNKNIKNIKKSQKIFYDTIFINLLKNYKFLKKPFYEIDILKIINDINLLIKLIYKFNKNLKNSNNFTIFNIYLKILYELFNVNLPNNILQNKVFLFTIIIFISNIIFEFFNKLNSQKEKENGKYSKKFSKIIIYLFVTSLFFINMIITLLEKSSQKGGVLIETTSENAFNHFIENSTFKLLNKGSNGLIILASLKDGINSLYKNINLNNFNNNVKQLIIKLVFIHNNNDENIESVYINDDYEFEKCSKKEFMNEINIQTNIFFKTFEYLQPLCPAIVYSTIYKENENDFFKKILLNIDIHGKIIIRKIILQFGKQIKNIGLIAMEYANSYDPIYKHVSEKFDNMAKYLLIELALKTGYTHSDFHVSNILIDVNNHNYFKGLIGAPLLIDFGWTRKIPSIILNNIKKYYNEKNYNKIIQLLCNLRRANGKNLRNYNVFDWVCNANCDNKKIDDLVNRRMISIDENIKLFDKKHENNKDYPLLPLSNRFKHLIYNGIFLNEK